jgi:hypothetical protein
VSKLPRPAKIVLPILRGHNDLENPLVTGPLSEDWPGLKANTWVPDIDYRTFPLIQVRRLGGARNPKRPTLLGYPVIELTGYIKAPDGGLPDAEQFYEDVLEHLYDAVAKQTQTPYGYLHSMKETLGSTQFSSLFQDSWRVQGLIQLGIRPPRSA